MIAWKILGAACAVALLAPAQADIPETTAHEAPVTFESRVNLVPIPVVVRDKRSNAVGNLTKDDFEIYDNGKLQVISKFSIEKGGETLAVKPMVVESAGGTQETAPATGPAPVIPTRFVAYVFDDKHFTAGDLMQARQAALKHFDSMDNASARAAVFATSGINPEDFTADRAKLQAALNRLMPRSFGSNPQVDCPYLPYHTADMISNNHDTIAFQAAVGYLMTSCPETVSTPQTARSNPLPAQGMVMSMAAREANIGDAETRTTIGVLERTVQRLAAMPGQRILVLVSPGFIFPSREQDISQLIDKAIRMNVVINAIDGRGLYVDPISDASRPGPTDPTLAQYEREEALIAEETLATLAAGTGGTLFAKNNDLVEGFLRTGSQPEFTYMLGFSPQNLKNDGSFHTIKVKLKPSSGLTVQARRGYFAPKRSESPEDKEKQDIEDALFTRAEMTDFPLSINTQFFKSSDTAATISIVARVGLQKFHFRKAEGRSKDDITVVTGLFDRDGNFLSAKKTVIEVRLRDETFEKRVGAGLAVRSSFGDVKPGIYTLRLVARDSEGQMMSTTTGAVEVP
jgi:VWFA-related protein